MNSNLKPVETGKEYTVDITDNGSAGDGVARQKMQRQLSKTVMICDDDNDLLQLFGKALKSRYNIILVSSGEDCIDRFIKEKNRGNYIHLILLDYKLGDIFGDSLLVK
jgi:response regulator RpfG family c-di-GMP phosphodiesterase